MGWSKEARAAAAAARKRKGGRSGFHSPNALRKGGAVGKGPSLTPQYKTPHTPDDLPKLAGNYDSALQEAKAKPSASTFKKLRTSLEHIAAVKQQVVDEGRGYKFESSRKLIDDLAATRYDLNLLQPGWLEKQKPEAQKKVLNQLSSGAEHTTKFSRMLNARRRHRAKKGS